MVGLIENLLVCFVKGILNNFVMILNYKDCFYFMFIVGNLECSGKSIGLEIGCLSLGSELYINYGIK